MSKANETKPPTEGEGADEETQKVALLRAATVLEEATKEINLDEEIEAAENEVKPEKKIDPIDLQADKLIKKKAIQVAVATLTAGSGASIPGLGTFAALLFGVAATAGITLKLQSDMVAGIAKLYGEDLDNEDTQKVMIVLAGISRGMSAASSAAATKAMMTTSGNRIAAQVSTSRFVGYIPLLGPLALASMNMVSTYVIGQRAKVYFKLGEEGMSSWSESVRAISGLDERKMIAWMKEAVNIVKNNVVKQVKSGGKGLMVGLGKLLPKRKKDSKENDPEQV